jgi:hypothetical protein
MGPMPAIPESTRSSLTLRLLAHARENWPKLENLQVTSRAGFAYVTAALPGEEPQPLFRLRYGGSAHSFGFALYSHATGRYEDSLLVTGSPVGTPQEALDTACTLYYASVNDDPSAGPPTNLRCQPLSDRLIDQRLFTVLVLMALVTTMMTGPLLSVIQRGRTRRSAESRPVTST